MKISDSEMEIMKIIWEKEDAVPSGYIAERLSEQWKLTTVLTFLKRLTNKKILSVTKEGKTNFYTAIISKEAYKHKQTEEFVKTMHKGSVKSLLAALYDGEKPSENEIQDIKKWFEEL